MKSKPPEQKDKDAPDEKLKIAIIGAVEGKRGVSFPWHDSKLPNVTDFDAAIVDLRTLQKGAAMFRLETVNAFRGLLGRLLDSGGQIVAIADNPDSEFPVIVANQRTARIKVSQFLPVGIAAVSEAGETLSHTTDKFSKYLQHLKDWKFHFRFSGVVGLAGNNAGIEEQYLKNREGKMLAGEFRWKNGRLVLLPNGHFDAPQEAIGLALEELGAYVPSEPPEWAVSVVIPGMAQIDAEAVSAREGVENLLARLRVLDESRSKLAEYRQLLYADGSMLEDIVARALVFLGGSVVSRKYGTEEYILVFRDREHLIEVKGVGASAALKHVRQLIDNQLAAEEQTGLSPHCILVVNAWRDDPPANRGKGKLIEFPDNVVSRSVSNDIALVSGSVLLSAVCEKLEEQSDGLAFLDRLATTKGVV